MSASKKSLLAIQIIEENFGQITADVSRYIIRHDNNSINDIVRYYAREGGLRPRNAIKPSQVRESLLILLQQNCLKIEPDTTMECGNGETPAYLYRIDLDMVINRLRFPKFLATIKNMHGELAVRLLEELIFHGRLRFDQVVEDVLTHQRDAHHACLQQLCVANDIDFSSIDDNTVLDPEIESQLPPVNSQSEIENMFEMLAESRFIVPAPSRNSFVASEETLRSEFQKKETAKKTDKLMDGGVTDGAHLMHGKHETSNANGKVTIKRGRQVDSSNEDLSTLPVEVRALMAQATDSTDMSVVKSHDNDEPPVKASRVRGGRGRGRGGARGRVTREPASDPEASISNISENVSEDINVGPRKDVLWMLGWARLAEEERNLLCISVTSQRMGSMGSRIVKLLLNSTISHNTTASSGLMSAADILKSLREDRNDEDETMDLKTLSMLLETMRCDSTGVVSKVMCDDKVSGGISPHYHVNKDSILQAVRRRLIHAIAEERFGYQSARIIELLQCKKYLEQQKISDMAILPAKEGRERLYDLFHNHWVDYMEVSKRGDFNPSSTYFFWTLCTEKLIENLLNAQFGTIYNLRCRYSKEISDGKSLLDFSHKITDAEEAQKFDKLSESLDRLDSAVLKIIENITVLGIL